MHISEDVNLTTHAGRNLHVDTLYRSTDGAQCHRCEQQLRIQPPRKYEGVATGGEGRDYNNLIY